jgi:hypothetical protein
MPILILFLHLGILFGPHDAFAVLANPDTTWADTVRVAAAKTWIAGNPSTSDPVICTFSSKGFFLNGIQMFVRPTLPGQEKMNDVELDAARAFRDRGADAARKVFAASALVDTATVTEDGVMNISRADGLSYGTSADNILHNRGELVGEVDLLKAGRTMSALETVRRWSPPPTALIITSFGSVVPLNGDLGTVESQVDYLLSGANPDSLPPGPIWKDSEEIFRDFEYAGRKSRNR